MLFVRKSTDYGVTWNPTNALTTIQWFRIAIARNGINMAALGYSDGVYVSSDGGNNWVRSPSLPSGTVHS